MGGDNTPDEAARRDRAARLRKQIEDLRSPAADEATGDNPEQQPGESDLAYVERRKREIDRRKRPR